MITAGGGGGGPRMGNDGWGWDVAARGLENLNSTADTARAAGSGLVNIVGARLQQIGNALSQISRR